MTILHKDVAVVGGGMVGGALALGLAQQGFSVAVLEKNPPADFDPTSQPDVRISAISASSVQLLRDLGVWDAVLAMRAHPWRRLETWGWQTAHVVFDAAGLKLPNLGYMVENNVLQLALWQALEAHPQVALLHSASLQDTQVEGDSHISHLDDDRKVAARLVVGADGALSQVRQQAGIGTNGCQYPQSSMLIT